MTKINSNTSLNILLYAKNQIVIRETEANLRRAVYRLSQNVIGILQFNYNYKQKEDNVFQSE